VSIRSEARGTPRFQQLLESSATQRANGAIRNLARQLDQPSFLRSAGGLSKNIHTTERRRRHLLSLARCADAGASAKLAADWFVKANPQTALGAQQR